MKAMILAAGRGERMLPLTAQMPKPLLPVGGKALIDWHLEHLAGAGIESVVVNLHYLADQIKAHLGSEKFGLPIRYSEEQALLETAGGILAALPLLGAEPFLVVNGDIFTNYDFKRLTEFEPMKGPHLVMVPNPPHHPSGDYCIDHGVLRAARPDETEPTYTYSGIGVYPPAFFADMAPGKLMLRPLFDRAVAAGKLTGEVFTGEWTDVGTPQRFDTLNARYL